MQLDGAGIGGGRTVIAFFARQLLKELRLVGGYEVLYGQVKAFIRERLFGGTAVDIDDPVVLRNLSEPAAAKRVFDTFKAAINALTVQMSGSSRIEDFIRQTVVRPSATSNTLASVVARNPSPVAVAAVAEEAPLISSRSNGRSSEEEAQIAFRFGSE